MCGIAANKRPDSAIFTKEDHQKRRFVQQPLQHALVNLLDFVGQFAVIVVDQPLKHGLLVLHVALEQQGVAVAEIDEGGKRFDRIAFGQLWILYLDHVYAEDIALVVDQLKALEYLVANVAIDFV